VYASASTMKKIHWLLKLFNLSLGLSSKHCGWVASN